MKVSIIMPSYNDFELIKKAIDSVLIQTLDSWELIIVDDGSTDNTKEIIKSYYCNKIKYIYQENSDQLNAIINGLNFATGEYLCVLHSDDMLSEKKSLENCVNYMDKNKDIDAIFSDLVIINKENNIVSIQKVFPYTNKKNILPLQLLWLGRNLYVDVAFHRKTSYMKYVKANYLDWNTPFWINFAKTINILNIKKVDFTFYKYRIYNENYINNVIGELNVINGELRTAIKLMKFYNIPFYKVQYILFRIFHKLNMNYLVFYIKKEQINKYKIINFIIKKRFGEKYRDNPYLNSLLCFYRKKSSRTIKLNEIIDSEDIYKGKDVKKFNNLLLENKLSNLYINLFSEMIIGFNKIIVINDIEKEKILDILKFLCIDEDVKILIENKV